MRCLIVDDEPLSQNILKKFIGQTPGLEVAATCQDAFEAMEFLQQQPAELLFLDVNMPGLSGVNFLKSLEMPPPVIFITAYPEFAVEGFNLNAVDYLLKPFSFERFLKAVNKAKKVAFPSPTAASPEFIFLKVEKRMVKVNLSEIRYLQAWGDYVKVFTADACHLTHDTLKNLEKVLPTSHFLRIHKSYMVALDKIDFVEGNRIEVESERLPIGVSYKEEVLRRLEGK